MFFNFTLRTHSGSGDDAAVGAMGTVEDLQHVGLVDEVDPENTAAVEPFDETVVEVLRDGIAVEVQLEGNVVEMSLAEIAAVFGLLTLFHTWGMGA